METVIGRRVNNIFWRYELLFTCRMSLICSIGTGWSRGLCCIVVLVVHSSSLLSKGSSAGQVLEVLRVTCVGAVSLDIR